MKSPYLNNDSVKIEQIKYDAESNEITFCFSSDGSKNIFTTTAQNKDGIKFISSSEELEFFLMNLMIEDPQIIKRLNKMAWDYIEGKEMTFPIQLVP
ncbi:hypothetical protein [Kalamiella sp. sgz302252]|uniref:hypothetical protein n=1 Tax=Pantoea sp. sgz302252 TaxID=3341827 RepID=UPI0036D37D18